MRKCLLYHTKGAHWKSNELLAFTRMNLCPHIIKIIKKNIVQLILWLFVSNNRLIHFFRYYIRNVHAILFNYQLSKFTTIWRHFLMFGNALIFNHEQIFSRNYSVKVAIELNLMVPWKSLLEISTLIRNQIANQMCIQRTNRPKGKKVKLFQLKITVTKYDRCTYNL